jgi:DeoR/GlpR family transcriptional regulator of sugar metabolism
MDMLVAERHQKIVDVVNQKKSIRVSELSHLFAVTEETIRRDLDKLEQEGFLRRSHGGAVSVQDHQAETPYIERESINVTQKKEIAAEAIKCIEPHDRIVLDASTTAWYMAQLLPNMPLTVVTNAIKVAMELAPKDKVEVISTGGILSPRSLSYVGPLAERSLDLYHVNKVFLSSKGIHPTRGITESNELQGLVKQKMIEIADQVYLLTDYSKFNVQAFTCVSGLDKIDYIITDSLTTHEQLAAYDDRSITIIQANND